MKMTRFSPIHFTEFTPKLVSTTLHWSQQKSFSRKIGRCSACLRFCLDLIGCYFLKFAAKTVNFEFVFRHSFFRIGVDVASYGPNQISMHFSSGELVHFTSFLFRLRTVVVVGSLYRARSRLQPSIFRSFFPTYLESVPPLNSVWILLECCSNFIGIHQKRG